MLRYQIRLRLSDVNDLRRRVLEEDHGSRYYIHPSSTKMNHDLREVYWWNGPKSDIAVFVTRCPNGQQVKVGHLKLSGLNKIMEVPTWKWRKLTWTL